MNMLHFSTEVSAQISQIIIPVTSKKTLTEIIPDLDWENIDFEAKKGENLSVFHNAKKYYLFGLGESPTFESTLHVFIKSSVNRLNKFSKEIAIDFAGLSGEANFSELLDASVNGLISATYDISLYKSDKENSFQFSEIHLVCENSESNQEAGNRGKNTAEVQHRMMDLVNAPANYLQPKHLAEWTVESGKKYDYEVKIVDKAEAEEIGLHSFLAVNQGSVTEPKFIIAEYKPKNPTKIVKKIGLVGKGVTYDTGGLSIKTAGMHYMKSDMGGAAMVLGTLELVARLQLPVHLIVIVPATENDVDAHSVKPGDVIGSYSGKTIEVIDTDAEGRLVLADGLNYMVKNYNPEILIDAATLTGNSVLALGTKVGAMYTTDKELAEIFTKIGEETGEYTWQLPLWDFYAREMDSDIADIKNYHGKPTAGSITAAKFLQFFTEEHPKWVHFDMAGVAFGPTPYGKDKNATGYGARLLMEFLRKTN
jgi:leucyl aminopeptidase